MRKIKHERRKKSEVRKKAASDHSEIVEGSKRRGATVMPEVELNMDMIWHTS
jgi:hypothetical protein